MELLKDLELVDVEYENDGKKAILTFLDKEHGEIRNVNFNRQVYRDNEYVDDADKAQKVDEWCQEYFHTSFERLSDCIGVKKDIYAYDKFNSLYPFTIVEKFTDEDQGMIINSEIKDIIVDDYAIRIQYEYNNKLYESKMTYGKYMEDMKQWYKDPLKKKKVYKKFEDKFLVPPSQKDQLIGHPIIVEVKKAFNKFYYGEIKQFPKNKKS